VVRPAAAPTIPGEHHWPGAATRYEIKADGWRAVGFRLEDRVLLLSRQGRSLAAEFPDVVGALRPLPVGTVVDGELCAIGQGGRMEFTALARRRGRDRRRWPPVAFLVFDQLATTGQDLRRRPLQARLDQLGETLAAAGTSLLQPVLATTSRVQALTWFEDLRPYGVEGIVAKSLTGLYAPGRTRWLKTRHTETVDAVVMAVYGPARRPERLVVRMPDGTASVTTLLPSVSRVAVGRRIAAGLGDAGPGGLRMVRVPVVVEVAAGTARHGTVRFMRLREEPP